MAASLENPPKKGTRHGAVRRPDVPPLENGDRLGMAEFLRRYQAAPLLRKAQLIEGVVHMPSPVNAAFHAEPDGIIQTWLGTYALDFPGLKLYPNATLILDGDNAVQPDAILCRPQKGGAVWLDAQGYLRGAPELICEIASTSASIDLHAKFQAYRRSGVGEYLVWLVQDRRIQWFQRSGGDFIECREGAGVLESSIFPGLILDVRALLKLDRAKVVKALKRGGKR